MKAEIQAAFLAASLTGCNQENPSVLFTHTAGTQPFVPQEENPCHSLPPPAILMVPPDLYKFQPTKKQGQDQSTHSCPAPQRLPPLHPGGAAGGGRGGPALCWLCVVLPLLMFAVKNGLGPEAAGQLRGWQGGPCLQLLAWLWLREEDACGSCPRSPGVAGLVSGAY